jgi:hypothetical protein
MNDRDCAEHFRPFGDHGVAQFHVSIEDRTCGYIYSVDVGSRERNLLSCSQSYLFEYRCCPGRLSISDLISLGFGKLFWLLVTNLRNLPRLRDPLGQSLTVKQNFLTATSFPIVSFS